MFNRVHPIVGNIGYISGPYPIPDYMDTKVPGGCWKKIWWRLAKLVYTEESYFYAQPDSSAADYDY
jgi:hypothetical protein